ncbi:12859_t:CDS:2, partial [Entrophospora sp. SA101]
NEKNGSEEDLLKEMDESNMIEFKNTFQKMDNDKKWFLRSGRCVEDELYAFGMKCRFEHLAHSFIIDPDDKTYIQNKVFTSEELGEIRNTEAKDLPQVPIDLLEYISSFRKKTTKDLRIVLNTQQDWEGENFDKTKHFNFDWIKNSVHNLLLEYEFDTLQKKHLEAWYNIHVWSLIDKSFNELKGMDVSRGESCSIASSKRKNKKRIVKGLLETTRKALGRRGDLILRKGVYEYGASEVGKDYEGENGTKLLKERGLKSPKMLKDMFVDLGNFVKWERNKLRQLELVSFIHSGLFMMLLRMDAPAGYLCRITRSDTLQIPTDVKCFEQALKCIVLTWKAKMIICKTINIVEEMNDDDALEYLQEAGGYKHKNSTIIIPDCPMTPRKRMCRSKLVQIDNNDFY